MKNLAKHIAYANFNKDDFPFSKGDFAKLSTECLKVITKNFTLYPDLTGLDDATKD